MASIKEILEIENAPVRSDFLLHFSTQAAEPSGNPNVVNEGI